MVEWSVQKPGPDPRLAHISQLAQSEWGQHGQSGRQPWPESMEECGHYGTCFFCLPVPWVSWCLGSKSKANSAAESSRSLWDAELCLGPLGTTGSFVLLRPLPLVEAFPGTLRCSGGQGKVEYSPPVRLYSHSLMPNPNFLSSLRGCGWA